MNWRDFQRLIEPLKRRIFLLVGRAILTAIDNAGDTQKIQVTALDSETISDVERFQEYGLETYPFADAETVIAFLNGNRSNGIVLCIHDRQYRPKDLVEGEVVLYTDEDQSAGGHRIHLKRGQIIDEKGKDKTLTLTGTLVETIPDKTENITTKTENVGTKTITGAVAVNISAPQVALGGAWATLRALIDERFIALFNGHIHSGVTAGGANTGVPTALMDAANHASSKVKGL